MTRMTGRRALMEMLGAESVSSIFGNPGASESAILDSLEDYLDIEYIFTRQEGAAIGMADAYARSTQRPSFVTGIIYLSDRLAYTPIIARETCKCPVLPNSRANSTQTAFIENESVFPHQ